MRTIKKPAHCPNHEDLPAHKRGVCVRCYQRLSMRVRRGVTTWKKLEDAGIVKTAETGGRPLFDMKAAFKN
jgi:hypothetical protein